MPNPEGGSEFNTMEEVGKIAEKRWEETAFEPSQESKLLIQELGGYLSPRQQKLFEIQAYFQEKELNTFSQLLKGEHPGYFTLEDRKEIEKALESLTPTYEGILDRHREYPSSQEVIKELKENLTVMERRNQPAFSVWQNVSDRIANFQRPLILKEADSQPRRQELLWASDYLRFSIMERAPKILPSKILPKRSRGEESLERIKGNLSRLQEEKLPPAEEKRIQEETKRVFEELEKYEEENYVSEDITLPFSKEESLKWRSQLKELVEEKGTPEGTLSGHGKGILLEGEDIPGLFGGKRVEIWDPGPEYPVHIRVYRPERIGAPSNVSIGADGRIWSFEDYFKDRPDTIERFNQAQRIKDEEWRDFIQKAVEFAQRYQPEG